MRAKIANAFVVATIFIFSAGMWVLTTPCVAPCIIAVATALCWTPMWWVFPVLLTLFVVSFCLVIWRIPR